MNLNIHRVYFLNLLSEVLLCSNYALPIYFIYLFGSHVMNRSFAANLKFYENLERSGVSNGPGGRVLCTSLESCYGIVIA